MHLTLLGLLDIEFHSKDEVQGTLLILSSSLDDLVNAASALTVTVLHLFGVAFEKFEAYKTCAHVPRI